MNDKVKGFVLSISDYKEADVLMQVVTLEYGVISLVGKAGKKLDSKNHFLPMCIYEFIIDYKQGKTIYSVRGSKLIANHFEDSDIDMISFKNIFLEAALKYRDINTYEQLFFVFEKINKQNMYLLGSLFFSYLAKHFGIMPNVEGCAICANKKVVALSNIQGGFLCESHAINEKLLPVQRLRKFRLIVKGDFSNYDVLNEFDYDLFDFYLITNFFIENTDLTIRAYDFYRTLN